MRKMNKKGFTIVELVIVIAVIAILAGVLIPTFSGIVTKANQSKLLQEAKNLYTEYVGAHNYSDGTLPNDDVIIIMKTETQEGKKDGQYIAVKDSQVLTTVYTTEADALKVFKSQESDTATKGQDAIYSGKVYIVTVTPAQDDN